MRKTTTDLNIGKEVRELKRRLDKVDQRFDRIEQRFEKTDQRAHRMEASMDALPRAIAKILSK